MQLFSLHQASFQGALQQHSKLKTLRHLDPQRTKLWLNTVKLALLETAPIPCPIIAASRDPEGFSRIHYLSSISRVISVDVFEGHFIPAFISASLHNSPFSCFGSFVVHSHPCHPYVFLSHVHANEWKDNAGLIIFCTMVTQRPVSLAASL